MFIIGACVLRAGEYRAACLLFGLALLRLWTDSSKTRNEPPAQEERRLCQARIPPVVSICMVGAGRKAVR
jgi:hypothetical protein